MPPNLLDKDIDRVLDEFDAAYEYEGNAKSASESENAELRRQIAGNEATIGELGKIVAELKTQIEGLQSSQARTSASDADWRNREMASFLAAHPEYRSDPELVEAALEANAVIVKKHPQMGFREQLEAVHVKMKRMYPEKFPIRPVSQTVSASGRGGVWRTSPKKPTAADLPEGARIAMQRFVRQGVLTEEQYLADYQWDDPARPRGRR